MRYALFLLAWICFFCGHAQYQWTVRDPLDLDFIDFGDNKLLFYNIIGTGLVLKFSDGDNIVDVKRSRRHLSMSYFETYKREVNRLIALAARQRFAVLSYMDIGLEGRLYSSYASDVRNMGIGFSVAFDWYILRKPSLRLAFDNGVGPNVFLQPFPYGGTKLSFSTQYGLRLEQAISGTWWSIGIYNLHISNADIKGRDRNPALDAIGLTLGISL